MYYLRNSPGGKSVLDKVPDVPGLPVSTVVENSPVHHSNNRRDSVHIAVAGYTVLPGAVNASHTYST